MESVEQKEYKMESRLLIKCTMTINSNSSKTQTLQRLNAIKKHTRSKVKDESSTIYGTERAK